jgi:MFS family permease
LQPDWYMETKDRQRFFLNVFFFLSGICFSTWTSRIPTIKAFFDFNDAELGTVLLFMPIGSLAGLPLSGWLVSKFDSRQPMTAGVILLSIAMVFIGWAPNTFLLILGVTIFSFSMRIMNIALNTQALTLQKQFDKKINGMFHGLWSTGGIVGIGISTVFVGMNLSMAVHLTIISILTIAIALYSYRFLLQHDRSTTGNKLSMSKPDPYIVYLGLLVFFAAICEGGMFDWSGVYFKEIVHEDLFTLGYLIFMICMALSRFASDSMMDQFGMPRTYIISASLIMAGIAMAVLFPFFWTSMIGFCLVGLGTAAVIPMTFLLAGSSKKYSPGVTISIIATYSIVGMLLGPPLIGYVSHALGLRVAFVIFGLAGLMLIPISQLLFRHQKLNQ